MDTPRTEAALIAQGAAGSTARFAEFTRSIERELIDVTEKCEELTEALKEVTDTLEVLCEGERDDPDSGICGWDDITRRIIPLARSLLAKHPQEEAPELFPGTLDALRDLGKKEG